VDEFRFHDRASTLWGWWGQSPLRWRDPSGHIPDNPEAWERFQASYEAAEAQDPEGTHLIAGIGTAMGLLGIGGSLEVVGATAATGALNWARALMTFGFGSAMKMCTDPRSVDTEARGVSLAQSIASGKVNANGKLAQVLAGIENAYAANSPKSALEGVRVVQQVTQELGLGAGTGGLQESGAIVFGNVGGVVTTILPSGEITIARGADVLLHILPGG
jgi:hypothetical protein